MPVISYGEGIILFLFLLDQDRRCLLEHTVGGVAFRFLFRLASLHPILAFVLSRSISRFISSAFQLYPLIFIPSIHKCSAFFSYATDHCHFTRSSGWQTPHALEMFAKSKLSIFLVQMIYYAGNSRDLRYSMVMNMLQIGRAHV